MKVELFFGTVVTILLTSCESIFAKDIKMEFGTESSNTTFSAAIMTLTLL